MAGENSLRAACAALLFLAACHAVQDDILLQDGSTSGLGETGGVSYCGTCTLDYDPVCGKDNSTYSNKCYAECQLGKGAWVPGRCRHDELNPVAGCVGTARCAGNPCEQPWPSTCQNQLPADAVCFLNPCTGIQYQGQELAACAPLWVDPTTQQLVRCESAPPEPCICTMEMRPVCGSDGKTYSNKCRAACELGPNGNWTDGVCKRGCMCPTFYSPVCGSDGKTYSNDCFAACKLGAKGNWTEGECTRPCICTKEDTPVCGSDGATYTNACTAACELGPTGHWTEGACQESCICPTVYSPVCGSDGQTYSNDCFAACELGDGGSWTDGECGDLNPFAGCLGNVRCKRNTCDDGCADAPAGAVCFQNTCTDQFLNGEPVDPCAAVWVDPVTKEAAICPTPEPTISCSTDETAECFADPCSVSSCPADPTATCLSSYCVEGTFQDQPVGPCEAVYVDADGNRVNCDPVPAISCPSAAYITCLADLCSVNSCPADPTATCTVNYCEDATFQGQPVAPCETLYVDAAGNRVDCNATSITTQPIISCSTDETAECFADPCSVSFCPADPTATCLSSYCVEGTFQGRAVGPCEAVYVDANANRVDCNAVDPYGPPTISCPTNLIAECFVDPCSVSSCPADRSARCLASYCFGGTFHGQPVRPCEAVYVDELGKRLDCTAPDVDINACAPGSAYYKCKTPLPCETATCPAFPSAKCITKPCTSTYRGVELLPCSAIWVDPDTGDLVTTCDAEPVPGPGPEINCPMDKEVQCLADPCSVSSCPADPTATCLASYCSEGTFQEQPVGPCEAVYVDKRGERVDCNRPNISCSTDDAVYCFVDPCAVNSCPADPTATCLASYCVEGIIGNRTVGPCEAVHVDADGNPVQCELLPAVSCPTDVPTLRCLEDPCAVTPPPDCGAAAVEGAVCETSHCQHGVLVADGTEVPPCSAVWTLRNGSVSVCHVNMSYAKPDCICPAWYRPVCTTRGETFDSACNAWCAGQEVAYDGECRDRESTLTPPAQPLPPSPLSPSDSHSDCFCTMQYDPVCGTDGKTYGNACEAACKNQEVAYAGVCTSLPRCPDNQTVKCFADPCSVSSCPADPSARCLSSYCSEGTFQGQPVGPCEAVYVDTDGNRVDCNMPKISCSTNETAECLADPCSVSSCLADPTATCLSSYCVEGTMGNRTVGPCEAVYVDAGGNPIECSPPVEPEIFTCPPNAHRVMCTRENSDPCANATCRAQPGAKCISKPCVSTYGGVELPACAAIWFNPNTFELVTQCEFAFGRACSCPYTYEPVCAKTGYTSRTYPNSCAATCANATITKTGKCQHCNGAECTIGKMNDVCFLAAPGETQCWAKKYQCRAAEGTPASRGLGRCLPKDNSTAAAAGQQGRRLHRHLLSELGAA